MNPIQIAGCNPTFFATCSTSLDAQLPESGTFAIRVYDFQNNHTGNYAMNLERLPRDGQVPVLSYGASAQAVIEHASDVDWFAFDAFSGTQVSLTGTSTPGCGVKLELFDALGHQLDSRECEGGCATTPIFFNPPSDGRYFVAAQDLNYNNIGTITVALACVVGTCPTTSPVPSIGTSYCTRTQNSTGNEARISALGSRVVADNDVYLSVAGVPPRAKACILLVQRSRTFRS